MKILWTKVGGLWPPNTGGRMRTFHTLAELSQRHQVTVLTTHAPGEDCHALDKALPQCRIVSIEHDIPKRETAAFVGALARSWLSTYPVDLWRCRSNLLAEELEKRIGGAQGSTRYDLCVADFLAVTPNLPVHCSVPLILFSHNVEHLIWKRLKEQEKSPIRRFLLDIEWKKMRHVEREATQRASRTLAVSALDRDRLRDLAPGAHVEDIPTGVDTSYFRPSSSLPRPRELVFTGSMDWYPNEDAILYFVQDIFPRIRERSPNTHLTIVGRKPRPRIQQLRSNAVEVTGTVDDVRPFVHRASVYVVPLRIGGGTRLKVYEALSMGKAVVSTSVGIEGLPLQPGQHFVLADDPQSFADAVLELLDFPERRRLLGSHGRDLIQASYAWPIVVRDFENHCKEVAHAS